MPSQASLRARGWKINLASALALSAGLGATSAASAMIFELPPTASENFAFVESLDQTHSGQGFLQTRQGQDAASVLRSTTPPDPTGTTHAEASARPGQVLVRVSSTAEPAVETAVIAQARMADAVLVGGGEIGQIVTLHKILTVTGSRTLSAFLNSNASTFSGDINLDFESTGALDCVTGGTHVHVRGLLFPNENDTFEFSGDPAPLTLDFSQDFVVGQLTGFAFGVQLAHVLHGDNLSPFLRSELFGAANFAVNWDGAGFFTDQSGRSLHGLNVASQSGFAYFAADSAGGAVPEPAAWLLLIAGFGLAGAVLRRRRAGLQPA